MISQLSAIMRAGVGRNIMCTINEQDTKAIQDLLRFKKQMKMIRHFTDDEKYNWNKKRWSDAMFFEDDICWCSDSDKCNNTNCFRHMSNRKTAGIFTTGSLMGTEYCENYKESKVERTVRVWIGNDYVDVDITVKEEWNEDEIYEAAVLYVYDVISVEVL